LENALVFLDLNTNGIADTGEPTATTDVNGAYTLNALATDIAKFPVVVFAKSLADAGGNPLYATKQAGVPLAQSMVILAPPGKPSVVSPLTTLVAAKILAGTDSSEAMTQVQTTYHLQNIDLLKDYIAEKAKSTDPATQTAFENAHKISAASGVIWKRDYASPGDFKTRLANSSANIETLVGGNNARNIQSTNSIDDAINLINTIIAESKPKNLWQKWLTYNTGAEQNAKDATFKDGILLIDPFENYQQLKSLLDKYKYNPALPDISTTPPKFETSINSTKINFLVSFTGRDHSINFEFYSLNSESPAQIKSITRTVGGKTEISSANNSSEPFPNELTGITKIFIGKSINGTIECSELELTLEPVASNEFNLKISERYPSPDSNRLELDKSCIPMRSRSTNEIFNFKILDSTLKLNSISSNGKFTDSTSLLKFNAFDLTGF
jgi:hypothetical protein